jgi:hypothetical protein
MVANLIGSGSHIKTSAAVATKMVQQRMRGYAKTRYNSLLVE